MFRRVLFLSAVAVIALGTLASANSHTFEGLPIVNVMVNGKLITSDVPGVNLAGRAMLPVRAVAEALGADVTWDAATSTAKLTTHSRTAPKVDDTKTGLNATENLRASYAGMAVKSAYLAVEIGGSVESLPAGVLDSFFRSDTIAGYDGVHLLTPNGLITIHGSDIAAWKSGTITSRDFVLKWVLPSGGTPVAPTSSVSVPSVSSPSVIESRIEGDFEGWNGETIFKLENGQIWQQASYSYTYHYAYRPKVLIYKSGSVYKMKVDGVDREITVKRLK